MQNNFPRREREYDPRDRGPLTGQAGKASPVEQVRLTGVVTDCTRLNVRAEADPDARVIDVIPVLTEVVIDDSAFTNGFYRIRTAEGVEGFCVKKYIAIRK
jgi:Bacterial SH3 domain.